MARQKVKLAYIVNDSARKQTFKKRRKGLMKKVSELSTLCAVDACAIIYSQYETKPDVWPNTSGVHRVLSQFNRMPEMERSKKMVNLEGFIKQRIVKENEKLKKQLKDNREKDVTELMYQCLTGKGLQNLMMEDLNDLGWVLDQKLKEINKRIESLKKNTPQQQAALPHPTVAATDEIPTRSVHVQEQKLIVDSTTDSLPKPQWFTEWMNNPSDQMGFGRGDEVMMPFNDNHSTMWPNPFFP